MAARKSKADIISQYMGLRDRIQAKLNDGRTSKANRARLYDRFARIQKAQAAYLNNIANAQRVKDRYTAYNRKYSVNTYMGLANG